MATIKNPAATKTRVYKFQSRGNGTVRFIRGPNKMLAMQQVARKDWEVNVATQDDLEEHLPQGVRIERYEPEPPEAAEAPVGGDAPQQTAPM